MLEFQRGFILGTIESVSLLSLHQQCVIRLLKFQFQIQNQFYISRCTWEFLNEADVLKEEDVEIIERRISGVQSARVGRCWGIEWGCWRLCAVSSASRRHWLSGNPSFSQTFRPTHHWDRSERGTPFSSSSKPPPPPPNLHLCRSLLLTSCTECFANVATKWHLEMNF